MKNIILFNTLFKEFWQSEFIKDVKGRVYTTFGLAGVGTAPSIEPTKTIIHNITRQDVIEVLQIISLVLSILIALTVLYKFFKSFKDKKVDKEDNEQLIE